MLAPRIRTSFVGSDRTFGAWGVWRDVLADGAGRLAAHPLCPIAPGCYWTLMSPLATIGSRNDREGFVSDMCSPATAILRRMQVPDHERLFILGCFERPATLYMQQIRALNLIYALSKSTLPEKPSLAVIGAGAAGVTAAAAAAIIGWNVSIFDRVAGDVLSFAGANTGQRWLHPHIYDWPADGKDRSNADLCILDWSSGPANAVLAGLRRQWAHIRDRYAIDVNLGVSDVAIDSLEARYVVKWNGPGPILGGKSWGARAGRRMHIRRFDIVILAVGFGEELANDKFQMVQSYWKLDNIDANLDQGIDRPQVLVSGTGDGGLIDILRYSFRDFRHEETLWYLEEKWLGAALSKQVRETLRQIESDAVAKRDRGHPYIGELNQRYREVADELVVSAPIPLRDDVVPVLTGTAALPLTLEAAPLNRFLFCLTNTQYIQGPLDKVVPSGGGFDVYFAGRSDPQPFKNVIIRHGPTAALNRWFPDIYKACESLANAARSTPDPSREPIFNGSMFSTILRKAGQELETSQPVASVEIRQAAEGARADELVTAALQRYRTALLERIQAASVGRQGSDATQGIYVQRSVLLLAESSRQRPGESVPSIGSSETADLDWLLSGPVIRCVVGGPGVGKTTLLRSLAEQALADDWIFPIFGSLRMLDPGRSESILASALDWTLGAAEFPTADMQDALRRLYHRRLLQGRVVALLDGLDEMPPGQKGRLLEIARGDFDRLGGAMQPGHDGEPQRHIAGNKIVISSRLPAPDIEAAGLPTYAIAPLSQADIGSLVSGIRDPETRRTLDHILNELLPVLGSILPHFGLLLSLFRRGAGLVDQLQPMLSGGPLGLYEAVIKQVLGPVPQPDIALDAFSNIAFRMRERQAQSFSRDEFAEVVQQLLPADAGDAARIVESATNTPLVVEIKAVGAIPTLGFVNANVAEYLTARHVARDAAPIQAVIDMVTETTDSDVDFVALTIGMLPEPRMIFDALAELPESFDLAVLRVRTRAMRFVRGDLATQIHVLAGDVASHLEAAPTEPEEIILRVATEMISTQPAMAIALATRITSLLVSTDAAVAIRAIRFVSAARLAQAGRLVVPALSSTIESVRQAAAETLGELKDPVAIVPLMQAYLGKTHDMVFQPAVEAIAKIGGKAAAAELAGILRDETHYRNLRWPAARALGILRSPDAVPDLIAALSDPANIVRRHAAEALGQIGHADGSAPLRGRLSDEEPDVRAAAAGALGRMADAAAIPDLLSALSDPSWQVRDAAAHALMAVDQAALMEILRSTVADPAATWRPQATRLMAQAVGSEALPTIILLSRDPSDAVREAAADGLKVIPDPAAARRLLELLDDGSEEVRAAAVLGLMQHQHRAAGPELIRLVEQDHSSTVRLHAARALGTFGDRSAVAPLVRLVERQDSVGPFAALALGSIGDESAIPMLAAAWRRSLATSSKDYFATGIGRIDGDIAARELRGLLAQPDDVGRWGAISALGNMKSVSAIPVLLQATGDAERYVRSAALRGLASRSRTSLMQGLQLALDDADPVTRRQAALAAPFYANDGLTARLASLQSDPDASVAEAAAVALGQCKTKRRLIDN